MAVGKMSISLIAILLNYLFYFTCGEMYSDIGNYAEEYILHQLPYSYGSLETYMDEETVNIHYNKHHAGYTAKLNAALKKWRESTTGDSKKSLLYLLKHLDDIPETYRTAIRNNGGGYVNHNLFWEGMSSNRKTQPSEKLKKDINTAFESFVHFINIFTEAASSVFGSGYAWLSRDPSNNLNITTTANQDSPISEGLSPILVIDVWEHAYYLKHQNRRPEFIANWWKLVDWGKVETLDAWWKENK